MKKILLLLVLSCLSGCMPTSVTFNFGADDGKLDESVVIADAGGGPKILLIDVRGLIIDGPQKGLFSNGLGPVDDLVARLGKAEADPEVKAVVLRINSPGGSVSASDTMYREVRRFCDKTKKPVVASLGEVAASGGYYLALATDRIVTQPTTITGSIGVIIPTLNVSEGLSRIGITSRSIKSGANKDLANPLEPMREGHYAVLQGMVDEFYERFKELVVSRRVNITGKLDELTDGRVVSGAEAVRAGLADAEGDLRDSFETAKQLARLDSAQLVKYHPRGSPRPRTAYASTDLPPPSSGSSQAGDTEINLLQLRLGDVPGGLSGAGIYYLWMP
ncbi:MAG: signal peptide peptidase SppA [Pyrinomonadaceae bacterium]|nr:signal peptide peptidase SppA [Phycisphaerales bacterium]